MKYEKPQKGNLHGLTVKQHSFPAASICRFAKDDGRVHVYLISQNKKINPKPGNQLFCAKRAWDQRAESGFMKEIEDKYHVLADAVFAGSIKTITGKENQIVTDMFAIWNIRAHRKDNPIKDQENEALDVSRRYSKEEQEELEKNHVGVMKPDLTIPGRHLSGVHIQLNLFEVRKQMSDAQWGILRSYNGQFIVPDNFSNASILPLSPDICFFSQSNDEVIGVDKVAEINKLAIASSKNYFFANDLSKCPR